MRGVEIDDILSSGRVVPIKHPIAGGRTKYYAGRGKELRYGSVRAGFGQFDFYVTEVGFAFFVGVEIVNTHQHCPIKMSWVFMHCRSVASREATSRQDHG